MQETATSFFVANDETPDDRSLEPDEAVIIEVTPEEGDTVADNGDDDADLSENEDVSLEPVAEVNESQVTSMIVAQNRIW